jgi:hypothetical protein
MNWLGNVSEKLLVGGYEEGDAVGAQLGVLGEDGEHEGGREGEHASTGAWR